MGAGSEAVAFSQGLRNASQVAIEEIGYVPPGLSPVHQGADLCFWCFRGSATLLTMTLAVE